MKKRFLTLSLLCAQLLFGQNLIQNGSFEVVDKDIKKWGYALAAHWDGLVEVWSQKMGRAARDGVYKIELDTKKSIVDTISQEVRTKEGVLYLLSFDAYARKEGTSDIEVVVDGEVVAHITPTKYWQKYGVNFVGKGALQKIELKEVEAQNDGKGAIIDNVVLQSDITDIEILREQERAKYEILEPKNLDQIATIIDDDKTLWAKVDSATIAKAKDAALRMNAIIRAAIKELGLVNDKTFTPSDGMELAEYIAQHHSQEWATLRQEYSAIEKYGEITALGKRAIKDVWGKIYNVGFGNENNRYVLDQKGKRSISFRTLAYLLDSVIDKEALYNPNYQEVQGTTATAMDRIVTVILQDRGLNDRNPKGELREAAKYADRMNHLILEAIQAEGLVNDEKLSPADVRTINRYLVENYKDEWARLHGDDEENEESGYHLVQNDGATTRMYGRNVMNTIADGIYHLGYETPYQYNLVNEDGNKNQTFEDVAWWLDMNLKGDYAKLKNPNYQEPTGTTGTSFDKIIDYIYADEELRRRVSTDDIRIAARAANRMNELIIEAIKETGVAQDRYFSTEDIKAINSYLVQNYVDEWRELHGDDEKDSETGFHRIQNDGAVLRLEGKNLINNLIDGLYHLGFETSYSNNLVNEDGKKNVTFYSVAYWLNKYLQEDLHSGKLVK